MQWRIRQTDTRNQKWEMKNGLKMFNQKIQTNVKFLRKKKIKMIGLGQTKGVDFLAFFPKHRKAKFGDERILYNMALSP